MAQGKALVVSDRDIEFHLNEIDAWRAGWRSAPGSPIGFAHYGDLKLDTIEHHERALIKLGHEPTIEHVKAQGFVNGARGKLQEST
jgi:hypothetical protein